MATKPSVMSTWLTWLNAGPANANVAAPSRHATVERVNARRKTYMPTPIAAYTMTSVAIQAARSGRTANNHVRG